MANAGCDADWQTWWVGSRTQWNVTKDFYMGLDVMYSKMQSADLRLVSPTLGALDGCQQPRALGRRWYGYATDQDNWSFRFRVHRDFYP